MCPRWTKMKKTFRSDIYIFSLTECSHLTQMQTRVRDSRGARRKTDGAGWIAPIAALIPTIVGWLFAFRWTRPISISANHPFAQKDFHEHC